MRDHAHNVVAGIGTKALNVCLLDKQPVMTLLWLAAYDWVDGWASGILLKVGKYY
jgi:hypothetical protein